MIGKIYSSEALAYYNKGYQFPTLIMTMISGASNNVMFTALSKFQNDWEKGVAALRTEIQMIMFVTAPMMFGLYGAADVFIRLLLTDKWAGAIPFVRLGCLICLFWPFSVKLHALNSVNRSGTSFAVKVFNNCITLTLVVLAARISVYAMVFSNIIANILNNITMTLVSKKYLKYGIRDQIKDPLISCMCAAVMGLTVQGIGSILKTPLVITLLVQIICGVVLYGVLSYVLNRRIFETTMQYLKVFRSRSAS